MRRTLGRIAVITAALAAALWGAIGVTVWRVYHAAEYPGAAHVAADNLLRWTPSFAIRRTEAFRSTDAFDKVYNWYSQQFDLGPERFAQSNCLLMARSSHVAGPISLTASVMVCNTHVDRMMFVQRTYILRYPDWLRRLL
jgi:hypothetical protein